MTEVDARGMRCPWPALRLARAMREGHQAVELVADDPRAGSEIVALCDEHGWALETLGPSRFRVSRGFG